MTAPSTPPNWMTLSAAQKSTLLNSPSPSISVGAELLNFADLSVQRDVSTFVDTTSGDIEWNGTDLVSRDIDITLSIELNWGIDQIRVYRILTDQVTGFSARVDRGVFVMNTPDKQLGEVVTINGVDQLTWNVTGQDRASLLDRLPGYSYAVPMLDGSGNPVTVLSALAQTYQAAGLPAYLIDSSASASVLPQDQVWPMISVGSDDSSSTDMTSSIASGDPLISADAGSGDGATWRQIINDLHSLINYRAVWSDEQGYLRSTPYADPSTRAPSLVIDPPALPSPLAVDRKVTQDPFGVPNRWIFIWSNMLADSSGNQQTPTSGNGGVIVTDNLSTGRSSQAYRNGLVYAQTFSLTAATAADFQAQAASQVSKDMRVSAAYAFSLRPNWCVFSHFDVVTLNDAGAGKVQLTNWTEHFNCDDTEVEATST